MSGPGLLLSCSVSLRHATPMNSRQTLSFVCPFCFQQMNKWLKLCPATSDLLGSLLFMDRKAGVELILGPWPIPEMVALGLIHNPAQQTSGLIMVVWRGLD